MTDYTDLIERLHATCETGCDPELVYEAADAIATLVAERDALRAGCADLTGRFTEIASCDPGDMPMLIAARACAAHRAVCAERDAAVADAERYRWRRTETENPPGSYPLAHVVWKARGDRRSSEWVNTALLDAAIDAALRPLVQKP